MLRYCGCLILALASSALCAQDYPDVAWALNLPTTQSLYGKNLAVLFAHRFTEPARGHGKDLFGLDGGNHPTMGVALSVPWLHGLNVQLRRATDDKTLALGLQQQVIVAGWFRLSARVERFDETVPRRESASGTQGMSGFSIQAPMEVRMGDRAALTVVPTGLSRTTREDRPLWTAGLGLRFRLIGNQYALAEYYPRPARLPSTFHAGFAFGYRIDTLGHRFTITASNTTATVDVHVLGGDHHGGPSAPGDWTLGFNLVRIF